MPPRVVGRVSPFFDQENTGLFFQATEPRTNFFGCSTGTATKAIGVQVGKQGAVLGQGVNIINEAFADDRFVERHLAFRAWGFAIGNVEDVVRADLWMSATL